MKILVDSGYFDIQERIQEFREQLIAEGLDEELVQLVGTVPWSRDSYKEEIRAVIYEKYQGKP